ncbi:DUF2630 family protein [Dictyobacter arantiisoli]|uniref:DUF2630 domain-containing protein n=1 Tax=Dictyobacter arantiisoli TaxID=2014874 RepID=A0A5A5TAB5_9CHLR|nr:DUF2630 family protein [Dictyobacter arantiisoli]GCF08338.1 hypothetical protein KDI_19020 [Dictyobacter arantiisoli]
MDDKNILEHIQTLVDEEHELLRLEEEGKIQGDQRERVKKIEVDLDQCWDLLRQRRARRHAGLNPDDVAVRDASIVENYKQ